MTESDVKINCYIVEYQDGKDTISRRFENETKLIVHARETIPPNKAETRAENYAQELTQKGYAPTISVEVSLA